MARMRILAGDLTQALQDNDEAFRWVLDLKTGDIVFVPTDPANFNLDELAEVAEQVEATPERFRTIEPLPSHVGFEIMAEFTETLPESRLKERLCRALSGRHPFRRFKDTLCDDDTVRQAYFAFHDQQMLSYARQWLDDEEIDAELVSYEVINGVQ